MPTIAKSARLATLVERLGRLRADTPRRWGTLTAGEMLCHLGDAHEFVLGLRPVEDASGPARPRLVLKWFALYSPMPWPRGVRTRAGVDPHRDGTRPIEFEADRRRAITSLERLAVAGPAALAARHFRFGPMSAGDWHRWAYRHVEHHLRQFGL
jgi:hypothetical protein